MSAKDANPTKKVKKPSKTTAAPTPDASRMGLVKNDAYLEPN